MTCPIHPQLLAAALLLQACKVFAPLEDVRETRRAARRSDAGQTVMVTEADAGRVWDAASSERSAAEGQAAAEVEEDAGERVQACLSVEDGKCDEAMGTGACAPGTDRKDCCARPENFACDPIAQCGCTAGATCVLEPETHKGVCGEPITGQRLQGEHCATAADCRQGFDCLTESGVCARYCRSSSDCGRDSDCSSTKPSEIGHCLDRCSRTGSPNSCAEGLVCASLEFPKGDFCWKPVDCDMLRRDGKCQEDTGLCTKGTDPEDCCKIPEGSACNAVQQCGCEAQPDTHCYAIKDQTFQCRKGGTRKIGESCSSTEPCDDGGTCADKICRSLCVLDGASCGANAYCLPVFGTNSENKDTLSYGACYDRCNFEQNNCPGETVCAKVNDLLQYCSIPQDPCPGSYIGNGVCDDTRAGGSRICSMGTDSDCE